MVFERFRRSAAPPSGRVSCYGKLPFDREFLRYHLDSDDGRWVVSWIDGAHQLIAAARNADGGSANVEVRALVARGGGRHALAALIRPSTDGGGRRYPVCLFTVADARELREQWHLAPVWAAPVWAAIERDVLAASIPDRGTFASILDGSTATPAAIETCVARFDEDTRASWPSPWRALAGVDDERARQLAMTLVHLGSAQRAARGAADGIALRVPVGAMAATAGFRGEMLAAIWLRLFAAASGSMGPRTVVEVWQRDRGTVESVCVFGREPTPADLAHLLGGVGDSGIDDVTEPWDSAPSTDAARAVLAGLLRADAQCLADLWRAGS